MGKKHHVFVLTFTGRAAAMRKVSTLADAEHLTEAVDGEL
jgi:hypothetical protein